MYQINDNDLSDQNPAGELKIKGGFRSFALQSVYM